jgi:effector-binding domain-containing protein
MNTTYIVSGVLGALVLWSVYGYFASRVENVTYSVVESRGEYEIRLYPEHIVAQTVVKGEYNQALSEGFRIVAGYIFGGNTKKESISMTTPVTETSARSQSIAMTAPVMATIENESRTIAFGMPKSYTMETLPTPTDSRVQLVTVPEKKMAAIRFSWLRTDDRVQKKKEQLLEALRKDNINIVGEPEYAGYNAPGTPPWMTRNEVLVEVGF